MYFDTSNSSSSIATYIYSNYNPQFKTRLTAGCVDVLKRTRASHSAPIIRKQHIVVAIITATLREQRAIFCRKNTRHHFAFRAIIIARRRSRLQFPFFGRLSSYYGDVSPRVCCARAVHFWCSDWREMGSCFCSIDGGVLSLATSASICSSSRNSRSSSSSCIVIVVVDGSRS